MIRLFAFFVNYYYHYYYNKTIFSYCTQNGVLPDVRRDCSTVDGVVVTAIKPISWKEIRSRWVEHYQPALLPSSIQDVTASGGCPAPYSPSKRAKRVPRPLSKRDQSDRDFFQISLFSLSFFYFPQKMEFHWPNVCDFKFKVSNSNQRSFELIGFDSSKCRCCLRIDVTFTSNLRFGSFEKESHVSPTILNFLPAIYLTFAWFHEVEVAFPWQGETVPPPLICPVPRLSATNARLVSRSVWSRVESTNNTHISPFRVKYASAAQ